MRKTRLGWATNDKLNSIMEECIRCERLQREADILARKQGAVFGTWCVRDAHWTVDNLSTFG